MVGRGVDRSRAGWWPTGSTGSNTTTPSGTCSSGWTCGRPTPSRSTTSPRASTTTRKSCACRTCCWKSTSRRQTRSSPRRSANAAIRARLDAGCDPGAGRGLRAPDAGGLRRAGLPSAGRRGGPGALPGAGRSGAPAGRRPRGGRCSWRIKAILVSPSFLYRIEPDPPAGHHPRAGRLRAGLAAVVFPLEQHARRRAVRPGPRGHAARSRTRSRRRCGACWPTARPRRWSTTWPGSGCTPGRCPS